MLRQATHAGSWYSGNSKVLQEELQDWLSIASTELSHHPLKQFPLKAIICPHAGYRYSGATAAFAYSWIQARNIQTIFILGPSHRYYLDGCALTNTTIYETPLGNMEIDANINSELKQTGKFEQMHFEEEEAEHSIEMQLPYIMQMMHGQSFKVVPVLVGSTTAQTEQNYGQLLRIFAPYMKDPSVLFVISSDFCHWGSRFSYQPYDSSIGEIHEYISKLDHDGMELIQQKDPTGFREYLKRTKNTICGRNPIGVLLSTLTHLNEPYTIEFVKYAQSSPCKTNRDSSVSYAAGVVVLT